MKKRLLSALLALCMCFALAVCAYGDEVKANETADFTADADGALKLLNAAKWSGAEDSTWDRTTNTLTLNGVNFQTTAATAVKLPAGAVIVLADGSTNTIRSGDVELTVNGAHKNQTFINALDAEGSLTIQGDAEGTGTLNVIAGSVSNAGNGWTFSSGIGVYGSFTVTGGHVTATGGRVQVIGDGGCAFSIGVNMDNDIRNKVLQVTGGSLTAIAGEAYRLSDAGDPDPYPSFSRGVYLYRGSVSVSGSGKLTAQSVPEMAEASLLSNGLYISMGDLSIAGSAEVLASGGYGVYLCGGGILLSNSGKLTAQSTQAPDAYGNPGYAVDVEAEKSGTASNGSITVRGGTLKTENGRIYMSTYHADAEKNQGQFTVTDGSTVNISRLGGAKKVILSGGSMETQRIEADELTLSGGSLTIREPVRQWAHNGEWYASPALTLSKLTVSGGTLDAAWDWGETEPFQFPVNDYEGGYRTPLVKMPYDFCTADFTGGTAILDTGFAGNTALKLGGQLTLGGTAAETGADTSTASEHSQKHSDTPVVFSDVERKPVTVTGITVESRTYDGTTAATLTGGTLAGVANGDEVSLDLSGVTAEFEDANADVGKPVAASGTVALRGRDAYKYVAEQPTFKNLTATISACTEFTDVTNRTQTITTGSGSFAAPRFTGIGGESVEGDVTYNKTAEEIAAALSALKAGESFEIGYTFKASGNYTGTKTGTITVTVQDAPATYAVHIAESEHGTISSSRRSAERGQTVTLTVTPESGYALETLTVTDSRGNALELSDLGSGKYSFKMPGSRVTVTASFLEDNTLLNFFVDVANADYFYESVKWAVENGVTAGVDETHFDPEGDCTRAQIVTFLWRAAGCPEAESAAHFADVDPDAYYAKAAAWAIETGVTQGTGETTFSPERPCTRAEAVTFLARALNGKAEPSAAFDDVAAEDYFAAAVAWAVENGITEGTGNGRFSPEARCTRAQIVTFLWRAYGK